MTDQPEPRPCPEIRPHPGHRYMLGRLVHQCPGVTGPSGPIGAALRAQAEREQRTTALPAGRKLLDQLRDAELTQLYNRAEQAEAAITRVRAELDRLAALPTVDKTETRSNRFSVGASWAIRLIRAALDEPKEPRT